MSLAFPVTLLFVPQPDVELSDRGAGHRPDLSLSGAAHLRSGVRWMPASFGTIAELDALTARPELSALTQASLVTNQAEAVQPESIEAGSLWISRTGSE